MATRTASVSGDWSNTATWGGAAVPVAGDDVVINSAITVTIDDSAAATIDIGSDSGANDAIVINGKLRVGAANANANDPGIDHTLRCRGHLNLASGGELNIGTDLTSGRIPSARKFVVELNYSASPARNKYQFKWTGKLLVNGYNRDAQHCRDLLASTAASAQKNVVLTGTVPSSWVANDQVILSATGTSSTQQDVRKIASVASATVTVDLNLTYQHMSDGAEPRRGECINAERNVIFRAGNGSSADVTVTTANGWCCTMAAAAVGVVQWARFQDLTYNANNAWLDYVGTTAFSLGTAGIDFEDCMFVNVDRGLLRLRAAAGTGLLARNCSVYNVGGGGANANCVEVSTTSATGTPYDVSGMWIVGCQSAGQPRAIYLLNQRATRISGSRVSGMYAGLYISCTSGTGTIPTEAGLYDGFSSHSHMGSGMEIGTAYSFNQYDVDGLYLWANTNNGLSVPSGVSAMSISDCTLANVMAYSNGSNPFYSQFFFRDVTFLSPSFAFNGAPLLLGDGTAGLIMVDLGAAFNTGGDVGIFVNASVDADFLNPIVGTYNTFASSISYRPARLRVHREHGNADYKIFTNIGQINEESTTRHTASGYAWKFTPSTFAGGSRLRSPLMRTVVAAGLPVTLSVWTAKDAAYTGGQQSLRVLYGFVPWAESAADQVASATKAGANTPPIAGDWEQLSVTVTPTEAGVLEYVWECDGGAGNVYFDDAGVVQ